MIDPREKKLPKWAQELLRQERLKTALRFPDSEMPEPDFTASPGFGFESRPPEGATVFSEGLSGIRQHYVGKGGYLYKSSLQEGFGSRASGYYYITLGKARLAHKWRIAMDAARHLLAVDHMEARK